MATKTKSKTRKLSWAARQAKIAKDIEKKNKLFNSMTPNQRRVAIAKDVLSQIDANKYKPASGVYVVASNFIDTDKLDVENVDKLQGQQVCSLLPDNMPSCAVCARGAMFMSALNKFNRLKVGDLATLSNDIDNLAYNVSECETDEEKKSFVDEYYANIQLYDEDFERYERRFFTKRQIELMETMFENQDYTSSSNDRLSDAAVFYGSAYATDKARLREICNNIIRNKGDFVIPQKFIDEAKKANAS